ncbi:PLP-dependent aminotransferase family protein [Streptomyces sp. NBC_00320]|uniref:MocR-like pyridoxine biosynthesis transcription factor PdxR n=1 Tax=Streptomyces sp. NBC_00320 TaxID=2975711 RepID=UPI00224CA8D3|nr:PLP-dependent aminotransferase family protein [Streptomyces sp. NBC_00320]MCX5148088.1 PLP-dependent aminotransferase family protein [Streptomyces sp. NBC_00320]
MTSDHTATATTASGTDTAAAATGDGTDTGTTTAGPGASTATGTGSGPDVGTGAGADLHLELSPRGARRTALAQALRDAVRSGRLVGGTRLPPYRALAADLGLARNAVADAYAELVAEGWFTARQGSGTRVAEGAATAAAPAAPAPATPEGPRHDLLQGKPDPASFPRGAWSASARRALAEAPTEAFGPGDPQGRPELRRALAAYLSRARGVRTGPENIVVCSGFANGLRLLASLRPRDWAVEEYGLPFHRGILEAAGVRPHPVPVDEDGARPDEIPARARTLLLTPAHQFPTGAALLPARRAAAVEWARTTGGLIVEDDYDGEFRYDRKAVGAVQGLDPEHVVYAGSLSKSLSPAIRLGWLVLPDHLVDRVLAAKGLRESWASALDQLALADFIACGAYDRHIRRMRHRYRGRRDQLVSVLASRAPELRVTGISAGLHAVLELPPGREAAALRAARAAGLALDGLSEYRHPAAAGAGREGLVVGYAAPPEAAFGRAVEALAEAMGHAGAAGG